MTRPIADVLCEHTNSLMALPGVVGTAQGEQDGKPCIMVLLVELTDDLRAQVPKELDGYPVVISETGEIKAL